MHIINGDSAAGSFRQAFHIPKEEILVFRDVLSCGGLAGFKDTDSWSKYRRDYWTQVCAEQGFGAIDDMHKAPRDLYNNLADLKSADVTLWMGCALSDQLLLVFVVKLFDHLGLDFGTLSIRQYRTFDKRNLTVVGVGILSPGQIKKLKPEAFTLDENQISFCLEVWEAVTAAAPEGLMRILDRRETCLPLLHKALTNFLYRYPDIANGLSRFDEIILNAAKKHAPNTARVIGYALGYDLFLNEDNIHELDAVGDIYLFYRLKNMAKNHLNKPLLSLNMMDASLRNTTVEVTDFGLEVLDGKHNVVRVNGIDDWVAGVRLDASTGKAWFRNGGELVLKRI